MKEEDIIANNKLIAVFMGRTDYWEVSYISEYDGIQYFREGTDEDLKYHEDWRWLIPVVEKIESLGYFCMINRWTSVYTGEEKEGRRIQITSVQGLSKIENTYLAILAFINWYNSQKT